MAEIKSADTAGTVENKSEQQLNPPTPKSKSGKASGSTGSNKPKLNERGVPITNWDNPKNDPNERKHVGESPDGEGNKIVDPK